MSQEPTPSAGPRLLGPAEVRSLAAAAGLRPTKQRGQNFVIDPNTVRRIVRAAGVGPDDAVLEADALRLTGLPGPAPVALVANLPYNVSVPVLLHLLELLPSLRHGLVMVQAEVADRLVAEPGSRTYGVPSVNAAWYAELRRAGSVGRTVFWPAPNVDSGLVALERRTPPATAATRQQVFRVVDAAFAQRRKTLRSALRTLAPVDVLDRALPAAGVD